MMIRTRQGSIPDPDERGNLSGAQGGISFMGKGGASAGDALPSFDPAFSLRKKRTGYGPIFFPPVLPRSSPSRPGFVYHCEFINLFKSTGWQGRELGRRPFKK